MTINLENRREIDFSLILGALRNNQRTFTELLHKTHLPRKTLNLRLKDLINSGRIMKKGGYHLNGSLQSNEWDRKLKRHISFERKHILLLLLVLSIGAPVATHVYAIYMRPPPPPGLIISEVFTAEIVMHDVTDLYAWQVAVTFDPNVLTVINVPEEGFLNTKFPCFVWSDHSFLGEGNVLIGTTLLGNVPGVCGSGTLATIEFGVIGEGSRELQLVYTHNNERVLLLLDSMGTEISSASITLET